MRHLVARSSANINRHGYQGDVERSENVAFRAFPCVWVPGSSEGGPFKWLKLKNQSFAYEPGREFESLRARANTASLFRSMNASVRGGMNLGTARVAECRSWAVSAQVA